MWTRKGCPDNGANGKALARNGDGNVRAYQNKLQICFYGLLKQIGQKVIPLTKVFANGQTNESSTY